MDGRAGSVRARLANLSTRPAMEHGVEALLDARVQRAAIRAHQRDR